MKVRGVMHMISQHSSSGGLPLPELKKQLFGHGLSFCCVTESAAAMTAQSAAAFTEACHRSSDQAFVFIPGFAVEYKDATLLLVGTSVFKAPQLDEEMLAAWRQVTPLVYLACGNTLKDDVVATLLPHLNGIEVWNEASHGPHAPHPKALRLFHDAQSKKKELVAVGGIGGFDYKVRGPYIELELDVVDRAEILRQLSLGFYTISNGRVVLGADGVFRKGGGLLTRSRGLIDRATQRLKRSAHTLIEEI